MIDKEKEAQFLEEYYQLCEKYGLVISGWQPDMYRVSEDGYPLDIYTSDEIEEMNQVREENQIRDRKKYWGNMGVETDDEGNPLPQQQ
jgi:hypothetical protein